MNDRTYALTLDVGMANQAILGGACAAKRSAELTRMIRQCRGGRVADCCAIEALASARLTATAQLLRT